jgi:PST family polysaccharide transporter
MALGAETSPRPPPSNPYADPRDALLDSRSLERDLRWRSTRSAATTLAFQSLRVALQLAGLTVLGRLLTPEAYGLMSMVTAITGFAALFSDLGLSLATVQRQRLTHRELNALFWVSSAMGLLLGLVVAACAPLIAALYGEPRLLPMTMALALAFPVSGLLAQHRALFNRNMRFGRLGAIEVTAMAVGLVVGITVALRGGGEWALVAATLSDVLIQCVLMWWASPWRPSSPLERADVRPLLAFGGYLSAYQVVNYALRRLDDVLVGWRFGPTALGLYSRAYSLLMLPIVQVNAPIAAVMLPALSRVQSDPQRFARGYLHAVRLLAWLTFPLVAGLIVCADELVPLLLGEQWRKAVPLFQIFGVSAMLQPIANTSGWLMTTSGRSDRMLRWSLISLSVRFPGLLVALWLDVTAFALIHSITSGILFIPCLAYASRTTSVGVADVLRRIAWPFSIGVAIVGATLALRIALPGASLLLLTGIVTASVLGLGLAFSGDWREGPRLWADLRAPKVAS